VTFEGEAFESRQERRELIAARAYELFEARGGEHGRDQEDWLEAERQLVDEELIEARPGSAPAEAGWGGASRTPLLEAAGATAFEAAPGP